MLLSRCSELIIWSAIMFWQAMIVRGFRGDSSTHKIYSFRNSSVGVADFVSLFCLVGIVSAALLSERFLVWTDIHFYMVTFVVHQNSIWEFQIEFWWKCTLVLWHHNLNRLSLLLVQQWCDKAHNISAIQRQLVLEVKVYPPIKLACTDLFTEKPTYSVICIRHLMFIIFRLCCWPCCSC